MRLGRRPDFRQRRERDFWRPVNGMITVLIVLGGALLILIAFLRENARVADMERSLSRLERQIAEEELLLRKQQREEDWLIHDPEYVERLARERLDLMKEGETVFRLDTDVPGPPPPPPEPEIAPEPTPLP